MGFPLHPKCLSLGAWAGSQEMLEAAKAFIPSGAAWPPRGLVTWAARGAYANLQTRQERVVRWLVRQNARIEERDTEGLSLLDWASWAGSEPLVDMALRSGLLVTSSQASKS